MTDAGPPTTVPAPDLPRLPDATPAPTPTPTPAPDPHAEPASVELDERPAPNSSGTPVGFFVLMLIIIGAIVAIAAVVRPWESSPDDTAPATSVAASAASTTPATTTPATTSPATTTPTTPAPASSPSTILVVAPLPTTRAAANTEAPLDPFEARTEACATEQRTLEVAVEAYVISTGEQPTDPEDIVTEGLLRPDPEGWSTRWAFAVDGGVIAVVPVPGGACDL